MELFERISLQRARNAAFGDDVYELDDWEGFTCPECGWRGLSAKADFEGDGMESECSECGHVGLELSDGETDWDKVEEKLPEEYADGSAMETDLPECEHCGRDMRDDQETETIELFDQSAAVHERCAKQIWNENIAEPNWWDTFTPEHYEAAADYLRSMDTIGCVITKDGREYMSGEMWVHTNYVTTSIVRDVVDAFNGEVYHASIQRVGEDSTFSCVEEHGECFEILIDFATGGPTRESADSLERYSHTGEDDKIHSQDYFIKEYNENLKEFDADFSKMPDKGPESVPDKIKGDR